MIKAIIFDCFGVIINDESFRSMLARLEKTDPQKGQQIVNLVDQNCEGLITQEESRTRIAALLNVSPEDWQKQLLDGEIKDPQMIDLIKELRKNYKTAIVSNVGAGGLHQRFAQEELDELFDVVIASGDVSMAKPDPRIFELAANQLGVAPYECVFVDDYEPYTKAAERVGMQAIPYTDVQALRRELKVLLADSED